MILGNDQFFHEKERPRYGVNRNSITISVRLKSQVLCNSRKIVYKFVQESDSPNLDKIYVCLPG